MFQRLPVIAVPFKCAAGRPAVDQPTPTECVQRGLRRQLDEDDRTCTAETIRAHLALAGCGSRAGCEVCGDVVELLMAWSPCLALQRQVIRG